LDLLLGDTFLRNVYFLVDYGDLVSETSSKDQAKDGYVQLISTLNEDLAKLDFMLQRGLLPTFQNSSNSSNDILEDEVISASATGGSGNNEGRATVALILAGIALLISLGTLGYALLANRQKKEGGVRYEKVSNPSKPLPFYKDDKIDRDY
jgi:hypothetical protein